MIIIIIITSVNNFFSLIFCWNISEFVEKPKV